MLQIIDPQHTVTVFSTERGKSIEKQLTVRKSPVKATQVSER